MNKTFLLNVAISRLHSLTNTLMVRFHDTLHYSERICEVFCDLRICVFLGAGVRLTTELFCMYLIDLFCFSDCRVWLS